MKLLLCLLLPIFTICQNLDDQEINQILNAHNNYRLELGLDNLVWSKALATSSKKWANKLISSNQFKHSNTDNGENIYYISGADANPIEVVDSWASEKEFFNYQTKKCIENCCDFEECCQDKCGHYTQIIWRDTKEVGCAVSKKGSTQIWVCQYNPPGNYVDEKTY